MGQNLALNMAEHGDPLCGLVGAVALRVAKAQTLAHSSNKPAALLLCRDLMWEEP